MPEKVQTGKILVAMAGFFLPGYLFSQTAFRVPPYLQCPAESSISITWFSEQDMPGECIYRKDGATDSLSVTSDPVRADALDYSPWEDSTFFAGDAPSVPYLHRLRITGLEPGTKYHYTVRQGPDSVSAFFRTAPDGFTPVRCIVYADSETEPESTGKYTSWPDPETGSARNYHVDQTAGYNNNLRVMASRNPDLIFIAGDLVESGGEQRDWDEFWRHNAGEDTISGPARYTPILAVPGNHEYYEGPRLGKYDQPGSERAIRKYLTYFETPSSGSPDPDHEGRYHFLRYGPAAFILLDGCNNGLNGSGDDTNFYLLGEQDPGGGNAPDFGPGSRQYLWLDSMLRESQTGSLFTFVIFHHAPYSSGPHGFPAGTGPGFDNQSGHPLRVLTPLFLHYGVDAVFSGHDEIWERSVVTGLETGPNGEEIPHAVHFYDVGTGGDGLRGPSDGTDNPFQEFLVHTDVPEYWEDSILVDGGKHYGHLEVEILPVDDSTWQAILTPVYVFPLYDSLSGTYPGFERRIYDDTVLLAALDQRAGATATGQARTSGIRVFPNPFTEQVRFELTGSPGSVMLEICDLAGRTVHLAEDHSSSGGFRHLQWDGHDPNGCVVPPGIYLWQIRSASGILGQGRISHME